MPRRITSFAIEGAKQRLLRGLLTTIGRGAKKQRSDPSGVAGKPFVASGASAYPPMSVATTTQTIVNGKSIITKDDLKVKAFNVAHRQRVFTAVELAWELESEFRAPLRDVREYVEQLVGEGLLHQIERGYYSIEDRDSDGIMVELARTKIRNTKQFESFLLAVNDIIENDLPMCKTISDLSPAILTQGDYAHRKSLGWRGVYLFLLDSAGRLKLIHRTSLHENAYLKAAKPRGVAKTVLEGKTDLYRVEIGRDSESTLQAFEDAGFKEVDSNWVNEALLSYGLGTVELLPLRNSEGQAVGVLLLRDPLYFGETRQEEVDLQLVRLGRAIGDTIPKLEPVETTTTEELAQGVKPNSFVIPRASKLLTDDLLYVPQDGIPYPRNEDEFYGVLRHILDDKGRFPGDSEPLIFNIGKRPSFAPDVRGVHRDGFRRKGVEFFTEDFTPSDHTRGKENGLIYVADLTSQQASFSSYNVVGCSYDRGPYYKDRFFASKRVPFVWQGGWPVSFAALNSNIANYEGKPLVYSFIHFVMTVGRFQQFGLTSYSVREAVSSLFLLNLLPGKHVPNLVRGASGRLEDRRFTHWVAAHSGRLSAFHAFAQGFGSISDPLKNVEVATAIINDADARITTTKDREQRHLIVQNPFVVAGKTIITALDEGVYPRENRYPAEEGRVVFPDSEVDLQRRLGQQDAFNLWLEKMGGEQGVIAGNGLYFLGHLTPFVIGGARMREQGKELGPVWSLGDKLRGWAIKR